MPESREQAHWESVYTRKAPTEVSWFEPEPHPSLQMIEETGLSPDASVLDVGGGASRLAAVLRSKGWSDIVVADLSRAALDQARSEASPTNGSIDWVEADIRQHDFGREFDLWHDRAVFHFMVSEADQAAYLATLRRTLRPGGHLIVATFGPDGPTQCSGLPVNRYGADGLEARFEGFALRSTAIESHTTPSGNTQQFLYARFQRD